ncbi:hypothetical protein HDV00_008171 [Rhizophlyctis rosea]|nr:hypothetical protein HDV00_008171 [Rhizophlyctis rosea]
MKKDMATADTLSKTGLEGAEALVGNEPDLSVYLQNAGLLDKGLWRPDIITGTFDLGSRMDGTASTLMTASTSFPAALQTLASPLSPNTGFSSTPIAISSWSDYFRAINVQPTSAIPLLLSNALTLFHTIAHIFTRRISSPSYTPLSIAPGTHICVHIIEATQAEVELAHLYQVLAPLLRDITLDIFLIGPEIVVVPLAGAEGVEGKLDAPKVLGKKDHSLEYKSEQHASCIRVHFARAEYHDFPRASYPPHLILCHGGAQKLFGGGKGGREKTVEAVLEQKGVKIMFAEMTEMEARLVRERMKKGVLAIGEVEVNPFRQPFRRVLPSVNLPAYGNGFLSAHCT